MHPKSHGECGGFKQGDNTAKFVLHDKHSSAGRGRAVQRAWGQAARRAGKVVQTGGRGPSCVRFPLWILSDFWGSHGQKIYRTAETSWDSAQEAAFIGLFCLKRDTVCGGTYQPLPTCSGTGTCTYSVGVHSALHGLPKTSLLNSLR